MTQLPKKSPNYAYKSQKLHKWKPCYRGNLVMRGPGVNLKANVCYPLCPTGDWNERKRKRM